MAKNNYINVLLISGSGIIGGLINYAYHPIMLHYLSIEEFGTFGSLLGIFNILGILTVGLVLFLNREISKNIENKSKIKFIFYESLKLFGFIGIIVYFLYLLLSPVIANFLKIEDLKLFYIVGIAIIFGFFRISENAVLRGLKKFEFISILSIIAPIFKIIIGFILVFLGYKVYGAIIGFILGGIFTFIISISYIYRLFKNVKQVGNLKDLLLDFKRNKKDLLHFFLVSLFFAIFMNIDVILAKNLFNETSAGIYAGLSVLGKFLIFLLLSVETVYYGQIMEHKKSKVPNYLIKNPIVLMIMVSVIAIIFNYFVGEFILGLLKKELSGNLYIYLLILVYYSLLAFISFFTKILIAWKKYYINYIMGFLTILLLILIYNFGKSSLENFVFIFIFIGLLGTLITGLSFYIEYRKISKHISKGIS